MRYEQFRREYTAAGLSRDMLDACPMRQFETWLEQAIAAELNDPTAMVLGTVDEHGAPWQRIVLLKGLSQGGFVFYTNYDSDKARAIERDPRVSIHFPWNVLDRQVIATGTAQKISSTESAAYFATRPRESQIAAWASRQSQAIADRAALEMRAQQMRDRFGDGEIPMPEFWGGYRVLPARLEFWQGGEHRLHDRFVYRRGAQREWVIEQLQP
ncbi:Pyridoxine/pyridoxamine 5'-phosphate oxidase [Halioglobus japonicus]|nr:Pyridoxine/pyridoxamine 5'-phosphate oxidase [Halioglobus japonicus]